MKTLLENTLWTEFQPLRVFGLPLGRRMAVVRTSDGRLVVFSPVRFSKEVRAQLDTLGKVSAFVVPSRFHDLFFDEYFPVYRDAVFFGSQASINDHPTWPLVSFEKGASLLADFSIIPLKGMPRVEEHLFLHARSRTLFLADAFFNLPKPSSLLAGLMLQLAGIGNRPTPSRLFRSLIKDRDAFRASIEQVLLHDFDRIVPGHGEVVESQGRQVFRNAFHDYLT
ncbi:MAG TPA: hypothetical protein PLN52_21910 [Opitutaceae bacterium]|nr:hypothetical protein [Opitutaceae bacterium]